MSKVSSTSQVRAHQISLAMNETSQQAKAAAICDGYYWLADGPHSGCESSQAWGLDLDLRSDCFGFRFSIILHNSHLKSMLLYSPTAAGFFTVLPFGANGKKSNVVGPDVVLVLSKSIFGRFYKVFRIRF